MSRKHLLVALILGLLCAGLLWGTALTTESAVRLVLFYSPNCGHCHTVMTEVLPPLQQEYGYQLRILTINAADPKGQEFYQIAIRKFNPAVRGVPLLIIGDRALIGSLEIPQELPGLIAEYLAAGGVAWPDIPGLPTETIEAPSLTWRDRYLQDPVGSTFSTVVLVGLIATLASVARPQPWHNALAERDLPWVFLVIALIGILAAGYLSYVETTQSTAVCGPVGDCNAVQQSEYALLFGFLPMALFGLLGYLATVATFVYSWWRQTGDPARYARLATFVLTLFGTLFSAGLTFLEPFVIGATCMWCLTSAISMGLLLLFSAGPAWQAFAELRQPSTKSRHRR